jgi:hypothetical protein
MVSDKTTISEKGYNKFLFPVWPQFGEAEEKILMEVLLAEEGVLEQIVYWIDW